MWINIESTNKKNSQAEMWVTKTIFEKTGDSVWLHYGLKKTKVTVKNSGEEDPAAGVDFERPFAVKLSPDVLEKLFIKTELVYQMKAEPENILVGPVIGLLLGEQSYYYYNRIMTEYTDAMSRYDATGGLVCAFKTCSIDWEQKCVHGVYFNHLEWKWKFGVFPIPAVIYRRAFNIPANTIEKLKVLTGNKVFNSRRFTKWQMYKELKKEPLLEKHLPETVKLTSVQHFQDFLEKHRKIILKPVGLSRGRGICIFQKDKSGAIQITDYHDGTSVSQKTVSSKEAKEYVKVSKFSEKNYILQPYIDLAKIQDSAWDIRIVMQKKKNHLWACHGIECRVARRKELVTNISRGGRALSISDALKLSFGENVVSSVIKKEIVEISKQICLTLERKGDVLAELGIDIAIDTHQNYWIIESNVRPTYNGFKKHMDYSNYLFLCSAPIMYAGSLAGFERSETLETKN